MFLAGMTV